MFLGLCPRLATPSVKLFIEQVRTLTSGRKSVSTSDNSPSRSLVIADASTLPATLGPELEEAAGYARAEKAAATRRGLPIGFWSIPLWCETKRVPALPADPEAVAAFLAAEANRGAKVVHDWPAAGRHSLRPQARRPRAANEFGSGQSHAARHSTDRRKRPGPQSAGHQPTKSLRWWTRLATDLKGLRDRALLLLGFAGAFRRSELVALNIADLEFCDGGLRVSIRKSKTDQEGQGATIAIARGSIACPVDAVRAWIRDSAAFPMVPYSDLLRGRERSLSSTVSQSRRGACESICTPRRPEGGRF